MSLLERLAEIEHEQWMQWARTLMEKEGALSEERKERWRSLFVPYDELPEEWKEFDPEGGVVSLPFDIELFCQQNDALYEKLINTLKDIIDHDLYCGVNSCGHKPIDVMAINAINEVQNMMEKE